MPCVACEGRSSADCSSCHGTGSHELHTCPRKSIEPEVYELVQLVAFAEKGIPPVAGGMLDQAVSFTQGLQQYREDDAMWESEQLKRKQR